MPCAQQQPIAVNPGIDGADLADLEAHAATPRRVRALSHDTAAPAPAHRSLTGRRSQLGGKKRGLNFSACFFSKYDPSARARHYTGLSMQLHHFHHRPPRTKGQRPAQLELSHQSAWSTSPCRCWDQCACRPPSPSSDRCRSVGGRAGCAAQAWWQVRGQAQSVRPGGACDKGAVDRGTSRWLAPVDGVVHPPAALLHAHATPLRLGEQPPLGCILGDVFGQDDVAVRGGACEFARSYPHSVHQTPVRGWGREGVLHRYSNSSSKYFSEYSISWAVMMLRTRVELVR